MDRRNVEPANYVMENDLETSFGGFQDEVIGVYNTGCLMLQIQPNTHNQTWRFSYVLMLLI